MKKVTEINSVRSDFNASEHRVSGDAIIPAPAGSVSLIAVDRDGQRWEFRADEEGVVWLFANDTLEAVVFNGEFFSPDSTVVKAWFSNGVQLEHRQPILRSVLCGHKLDDQTDKDDGMLSWVTVWLDPAEGRIERHHRTSPEELDDFMDSHGLSLRNIEQISLTLEP